MGLCVELCVDITYRDACPHIWVTVECQPSMSTPDALCSVVILALKEAIDVTHRLRTATLTVSLRRKSALIKI